MTNITPYIFKDHSVRTTSINGEPWFVAKDVSDILGYRDAANMVRNLQDDEKGTHKARTLGGDQEMSIINESGLYNAIFRSKRLEAQAFRKWVTSEVLPAIRQSGGYIDGKTEEQIRKNAEEAILWKIARKNASDLYIDMSKAVHDRLIENGKEPKFYDYTNNSDMINRIVIGVTASKWRKSKGLKKTDQIRDTLPDIVLEAISHLQRVSASLIDIGMSFDDRKVKLKEVYDAKWKDKILSPISIGEALS